MLNILMYISDYVVVFVVLYIVIVGLHKKVLIYDEFMLGAKDGMKIIIDILPTLVCLMVAVSVMRSAGIFEIIAKVITPITSGVRFPSSLVPMTLIKLFSSSGATTMLIDIFKEYGPDSYEGMLSSVMMSASETVFYIMTVYSVAGGIKKTRYAMLGGLFATLVGVIISVIITRLCLI